MHELKSNLKTIHYQLLYVVEGVCFFVLPSILFFKVDVEKDGFLFDPSMKDRSIGLASYGIMDIVYSVRKVK